MPKGDRRYCQSHDDNDGKENVHTFIGTLNQWKVNKNYWFPTISISYSIEYATFA
jgi:hypothetical protein